MKIIEDWQYRYVERCLYNYYKIKDSHLDTERKMTLAIDKALEFFKDTPYEIMIHEFYFKAHIHRKRYSNSGHYQMVCHDLLFTEESNGYVIRREIVYKIAMNCYALGVFQISGAKTIEINCN